MFKLVYDHIHWYKNSYLHCKGKSKRNLYVLANKILKIKNNLKVLEISCKRSNKIEC